MAGQYRPDPESPESFVLQHLLRDPQSRDTLLASLFQLARRHLGFPPTGPIPLITTTSIRPDADEENLAVQDQVLREHREKGSIIIESDTPFEGRQPLTIIAFVDTRFSENTLLEVNKSRSKANKIPNLMMDERKIYHAFIDKYWHKTLEYAKCHSEWQAETFHKT